MILNSWIIAQLIGTLAILSLSVYAISVAQRIVRRWDPESASEEQLLLEQKSYLVSTIMQYVLGFQILSLVLFVVTADKLSSILTGAMCATGSLNANPYGFWTLYVKIAAFFVYAAWITINYLDTRVEDYPLSKFKFKFLLLLIPVLVSDGVLQSLYFINLNPTLIVSCCGIVYDIGPPIASSLEGISEGAAMGGFYLVMGSAILLGLLFRRGIGWLSYPFSAISAFSFYYSLLAIISFISSYIYAMPSHHCPFDMLKAEYYYIGYPIYFSLFVGSFFGLAVGFTEPLKGLPSLGEVAARFQQGAASISVIGFVAFTTFSTVPYLLWLIFGGEVIAVRPLI
ncbi:MAG: hypothetical protein ACE5LX_02230 [Nitrospinota bacterium]